MKNMPGLLFWILLPFHIILNILAVGLSLFRKQGKITIKAKMDALRDPSVWIRKRRQIQKNRKVSIIQIIRALDWNPVSPIKKLFPG
jgi:hypothetical protein